MNQKILILTGVLGAFCLSIDSLNSAVIVQSEPAAVVNEAQATIAQVQAIDGSAVEEDSGAIDAAVNEVLSADSSSEVVEAPVTAAQHSNSENNSAIGKIARKVDKSKAASFVNSSVDQFNKMLNSLSVKKNKITCAQAVEIAKKEIINSLDLSNVSDFDQNAANAINDWINSIDSTKTSGTFSPNLLLNLSNNTITAQLISSLSNVFNTKKKSVILNVSNTNSVNDTLIDSLNFDPIVSLNLSNTAITDAAIDRMISQINSKGLGKLIEIDLSGTKVSAGKIEALRETIKAKLDEWNTQNKNNPHMDLKGDRGVTYDKTLELPKFQKTTAPKPDLELTPTVASQPDAVVASVSEDSVESVVEIPGVDTVSSDAGIDEPAGSSAEAIVSVEEVADNAAVANSIVDSAAIVETPEMVVAS